jgi:alpha/beta superfamily hydrolase
MLKELRIVICVVVIVLTSCVAPKKSFENYTSPDYSLEKNWAALPSKKDKADVVPKKSKLKNQQDSAKVDVFYIHYTTHWMTLIHGNARLRRPFVNFLTNHLALRMQASVFNGSCKVYAPKYRQASIISFTSIDKKGKQALELAYRDVENAFDYYLKHYNNGRPFIIAGHSQGSYHAQKLIKQYIEKDTALYKQLVCAYLVGWANKETYTSVVPCDSAAQTGCELGWQTTRWGAKRNNHFPNRDIFLPTTTCTNPLTWKRDTVYAGKEKNLGGTSYFFRKIHPQICDAQIHDNLLWIHPPRKFGYIGFIIHYHLFDYNLFYMNVRENVKLRVDTYLKNK